MFYYSTHMLKYLFLYILLIIKVNQIISVSY